MERNERTLALSKIEIYEGPTTSPERICIYGPPKSGKSRFATALEYGQRWGKKAAYVCADSQSENMRSILPQYRDNLVRVRLPGTDPLEEAVEVAVKDWSKVDAEIGTIVWDTLTTTSKNLLRHYANSGVFSSNHNVQLGTKALKSWHTSPMEGDYGAAQNSIGFILTHLFSQPLHVIVIFHADWAEPKAGAGGGLVGGPETVGRKAIRWIPGMFDAVFRTHRIATTDNPDKFRIFTDTRGIWTGGYRTQEPKQKMPGSIDLKPDPAHFWKTYRDEVTPDLTST